MELKMLNGVAGAGDGTAEPFGAGLRPYSEGGAYDRRPGGASRHRSGGRRRGDQLPVAGPGKLGTVILAEAGVD